jgi:hypothetical protein
MQEMAIEHVTGALQASNGGFFPSPGARGAAPRPGGDRAYSGTIRLP